MLSIGYLVSQALSLSASSLVIQLVSQVIGSITQSLSQLFSHAVSWSGSSFICLTFTQSVRSLAILLFRYSGSYSVSSSVVQWVRLSVVR
jgi:hypothetical protein